MTVMNNSLRTYLAARSPRERRLLIIAFAVVALGLVITLSEWVWRERQRLAVQLPEARNALASMQNDAAELSRLERIQPPAALPLATLAQTASAAGASRGLSLEIEQTGTALRAEGSGSFTAITDWLASLQADQRLRPTRVVMEVQGGQVRFEATLTP